MTPDPLKVGERFDVRVETAAKGKSIVYQANTEGTITLEKFSPDQTDSAAKNITGTFQFVTENSQRGQIAIQGRFDLPLERKPVSQNIVHSVNDEVKG